jgi:hypothetical protein
VRTYPSRPSFTSLDLSACRGGPSIATRGTAALLSAIALLSGRGSGFGAPPTPMLTRSQAGSLTTFCREVSEASELLRLSMSVAVISSSSRRRLVASLGLSAGRVARLVGSAQRRFDDRVARVTALRLTDRSVAALNALLDPAGDDIAESALTIVRRAPGNAGIDSVHSELEKLRVLDNVALDGALFRDVAPAVVDGWAERAMREVPSQLGADAEHVGLTLLAALCRRRGAEVLDALVDLLIATVHGIDARAERRVERDFLADFKKVSGKTNALFRLAEAAIDHPDGIVSEVLFPVVGEEKLRDLVREYKSTGPHYRDRVRRGLRASYSSHYRRALPAVLAAFALRSSNTTHRPVLDGVEVIVRHRDSSSHSFPVDARVPLDGVVPAGWREFVVSTDAKSGERVNRIGYELCVLQALRDRLRCKDIWIDGSDRWRNPDDDLPSDFDENRPHYTSDSAAHQTPTRSSPA